MDTLLEKQEQKTVDIRIQKMHRASAISRQNKKNMIDALLFDGQIPADIEDRIKLMSELIRIRKAFDKKNEGIVARKKQLDKAWQLLTDFNSEPIKMQRPYKSVIDRMKDVLSDGQPHSGVEISRLVGVSTPYVYKFLNSNPVFERVIKGWVLKTGQS